MASVKLCPTFGVGYQAFTASGIPLNAGKIYTYTAGGTTPTATYTTSTGNVQNANPIILSADGRPASEIWLVQGTVYRFDVKDSADNLIQSYDNITGINDATIAQPIAATTLSVSGTMTMSGLTASTALALDASKNVVSVTNTGSGSNVLATSPTLVTPVLGVAAATSIDVAGTGNGVRSAFIRGGGILSVYDSATTEVGRIQGISGGLVIGLGGVNTDLSSPTVSLSGIGTTASAANVFVNNGSSPANSLLRVTSSLEWKEELQDMTLLEAQKVTFNLHGFSYKSKSENDDPNQRFIGYGAEEIAQIDGRFCTFDVDGKANWVQYERFVIPHGVVLSDHEARINQLLDEIVKLKDEIALLKGQP